MREFYRFPRTPHLAWLAPGSPREDKILDDAEVQTLLSDTVLVEEKIDGANLGFSVDDRGILRAQNRGRYLDLNDLTGQWKPLARWLSTRRDALTAALAPHLMLFGEWCYAVHSVRYTQLPDWYLAFDVFDRDTETFWCAARRNELAAQTGVHVVPELGHGHFDVPGLKRLLTRSRLSDGWVEGLYVRREADGRLLQRAKLVRAEFVQTIEEHWSRRAIEPNRLASSPPDASS